MSEQDIERLRESVLHQITAQPHERDRAAAEVREAAMAYSSDPAERIEALAEAQDWARQRAAELDRAASTIHIRKKAGPNLGNQYYSHNHRARFAGGYRDPQAETLCGATASNYDMSWAETRYPKGRQHVQCSRCIQIRLHDPKAKR